MNEHETDPQRRETPTTGEPATQPADAWNEGTVPPRGQSDTTGAQPTVGLPAAPETGAQPPTAHPQGQWQPQQPSPWQQPGGPHNTQPLPAQPGQPLPGQPPAWQSAQGQPHWQQPTGQQAAFGQPQYAYPGAQQPGYGQQQGWTADGQPAWAAPVVTEERDRNRGNNRGRRILVGGAVAVLIALSAGGVGAATALAFDKNDSDALRPANSSVTQMVDRSSLAEIASSVQDSVVSITTETGEGSGVIFNADGYILTNNHVVATASGTTVTVVFANGKGKSTATIVGTDPRSDLAVVKVANATGLKAAKFGASANMKVGDTVLAIGSPLGLEGSVTAGIISAKDRTIQSSSEDSQQQDPQGSGSTQQPSTATTLTGLLQTDAPINPGNSGGALVNTNGEVIGINSAIATQGSGSGSIGLGFAIPSDKARQVADDLTAGKKVSHPALGVSVADAQGGGAVVSNVTAGSAAAKAGLQQGDVVTQADGKAIGDANDLVAAVQGGTVGQQMQLTITRSGQSKTVPVTLAEAQ